MEEEIGPDHRCDTHKNILILLYAVQHSFSTLRGHSWSTAQTILLVQRLFLLGKYCSMYIESSLSRWLSLHPRRHFSGLHVTRFLPFNTPRISSDAAS